MWMERNSFVVNKLLKIVLFIILCGNELFNLFVELFLEMVDYF